MIGSSEMVIVLVAALVLLGPKKLPEFARMAGKATSEYRKAVREFEYQMDSGRDSARRFAEGIVEDIEEDNGEKKKDGSVRSSK